MKHSSTILVFLDDDPTPLTKVLAPVNFELDTRKLTDGPHVLKIISQDPTTGIEGIKTINFQVRNGPAIVVEGMGQNDIVDGILPLMVNAYSKGDQKTFLIEGSESPQSIPAWVWVLIIGFLGWSVFYLVSYFSTN